MTWFFFFLTLWFSFCSRFLGDQTIWWTSFKQQSVHPSISLLRYYHGGDFPSISFAVFFIFRMLAGRHPQLRQIEPCQPPSAEDMVPPKQCSLAHLGLVLLQFKGSSKASGTRGRNIGWRGFAFCSSRQGKAPFGFIMSSSETTEMLQGLLEDEKKRWKQRQRLEYATTNKLPDKTAANVAICSSLWGHGEWERLMANAARGNDSQQAELGEEPSASSVRGKNSARDGRRAHWAETAAGTSLPSSRTMPASISDSPRDQTASSVAQSIPPTGGNRLQQWTVGRAAGEGRLGASFLCEPPSGREALPRLRLSKGCLSWHVQTSQTDIILPSFSPHLSVKPICLTDCLGPEVQIQSLRVLHRGLRQGHRCLFIYFEGGSLKNWTPACCFEPKGPQSEAWLAK